MYRVGQHGFGREQIVGVVDLSVAGVGRKERGDEGDLGDVFGDVRLDGEGVLCGPGAERGEEVRRAGWRKAGGYYGCDQLVSWVDGVDVRNGDFCVGEGGFGGCVTVVVWGEVGVHADAADEGALASGEADVGEEVGAGDVGRRVVCGCCCAVGEGTGYAGGVDAAGEGKGGEGGFDGVGVGVEPGEEGGFAKDARVGVLGCVDMGVFIGKSVWLAGVWQGCFRGEDIMINFVEGKFELFTRDRHEIQVNIWLIYRRELY